MSPVVSALVSAGLKPRADLSGAIRAVCPLCGNDRLTMSVGDIGPATLSCEAGCDPQVLIHCLLKISDGIADHPQRVALQSALYRAKYGANAKPQILLGVEITDALDAAIDAVCRTDVYQRGGMIVDVVRTPSNDDGIVRADGSPRIRQVPRERLREVLSQAADWFEVGSNGRQKRVTTPMWVARDLMCRGQWNSIRPLNDIVDYPVLRPDGSVMSHPRYDDETGLIYEPSFLVDVPESPTRGDAMASCARILDMAVDFPFASDAGKSAWLAALLTPLARPAIAGPVPMCLIDANNRGVGKTMLADLIGAIVLGRTLPRRPCPNDPDEWRKAMTAIGLSADPIILLDNVTRTIKSDVLDMVLTGEEYRDRLLGKNEDFVATVKTAFIATANNAQVSPDIVRRAVHVRLDSDLERPEARTGFKWPNLIEDAKRMRSELLYSAMTILRAYQVAGRPSVGLRPMGSYDAWSAVVRSAVVWAGMSDPADTQTALREDADEETEESSGLLTALFKAYGDTGFTAAQLLRAANSSPDLMAVVVAANDVPGPANVKRIGYVLRKLRGRRVDGLSVSGRKTMQGVMWCITNHKEQSVDDDDDDA